VIEELSGLAHRLGLVRDKTWFVGALIQRENVFPGALGGGIAFLHTLRRNPEQIARPFMVLGRSLEGVEFDALDEDRRISSSCWASSTKSFIFLALQASQMSP
jgi:mannitol/fructose-specific phosphotransferase system IIA component (Ntr-type)